MLCKKEGGESEYLWLEEGVSFVGLSVGRSGNGPTLSDVPS